MSFKRPLFFTIFLGLLVVVWAASLWALSSLPGTSIKLVDIPHVDKAAHFLYFSAGGFLWAAFLTQLVPWRGLKLIACATAVIAVIGAVDELHQLFTPGRSGCDLGDWMADCAGGAAGAFVFVCLYVFLEKRRGKGAHHVAPTGD